MLARFILEGESEVSNVVGDITSFSMIELNEVKEEVEETVLWFGDTEVSIMSYVSPCGPVSVLYLNFLLVLLQNLLIRP